MRKTPITIKDVARESGVNISTVSRALNDTYGVHPETRDMVLNVAERLNYRLNRAASSLVTGRSHTLALIVADIRNPYFAELARGAEDAARAGGCDLVLCNSDLSGDKQMEYLRSLLEKRVDGILMNSVAEFTRSQQERLEAAGVPIVLLNQSAARRSFSTVSADNVAGGGLAAEYLLRLGHRHIAHLTGPRHHGNMTDRARGFLQALKDSGKDPRTTVLYGENSFEGGRALVQKLFEKTPGVTAIFAGNDLMAFGMVRAILDAGRRVPEDISLIGFDNLEFASVLHPPLTTIHQPKYEIGRAAADILLRLARDKSRSAPEHRVLGVELVERQSCREIR
ncbi:MAG: LacI family DNA-binding transcriptional regulator [Candidatus Solibacter sp.]